MRSGSLTCGGASRNLSACSSITKLKQLPPRKAARRLPEKMRRYAAVATGGIRPYSFVTLANGQIRQDPDVVTHQHILPPWALREAVAYIGVQLYPGAQVCVHRCSAPGRGNDAE